MKIKIGYEVYSRKLGNRIQYNPAEEVPVNTNDELKEYLKNRFDSKSVEFNTLKSGVIYCYNHIGIAIHKYFRIVK